MARRVGAAESEATSAKRREAIYSGKVSDWPWFKDKVSSFSCGNSMKKMKMVLLSCAALQPTFKAIYDKMKTDVVMIESPQWQRKAIDNESWCSSDWALFKTSVKSPLREKVFEFEPASDAKVAGSGQVQESKVKTMEASRVEMRRSSSTVWGENDLPPVLKNLIVKRREALRAKVAVKKALKDMAASLSKKPLLVISVLAEVDADDAVKVGSAQASAMVASSQTVMQAACWQEEDEAEEKDEDKCLVTMLRGHQWKSYGRK